MKILLPFYVLDPIKPILFDLWKFLLLNCLCSVIRHWLRLLCWFR
ncbi:unnamed protein product [Brassica oleracea var. botrytis]|uniref:(rape) hypothetical protein n=1 Tax=Brassica napus TaxID=3708 RepID=A0A816ILW9_BRANA|nr:unnamed protein product [Brassica napus]